MFFIELLKLIALKMVTRVTYNCERLLSTLTSLNFRLVRQDSKSDKVCKKCNMLVSNTPKNDL